jgi:hypothetical protein
MAKTYLSIYAVTCAQLHGAYFLKGMSMDSVNRNVAVIKPKQPFLLWLKGLPGEDLGISLKEMSQDCTVILIPEFTSEKEARIYTEAIYEELFEMELTSWCRDESLWPKDRCIQMFREWFEIEIHSEVFDTLDEEIEKELL